MAFESDKMFLTKCIKKHPDLWKNKSNLNKNDHLRNVGLDVLMQKCKDKYQEADRKLVRNKSII